MKKTVLAISRILSYIAQLVLLITMFLITFDVFGRYFFNKPIKGTFELTELGLALMVFFGLAITHWHKEHVEIDFLIEKLSKKTKRIIDAIINAIISISVFIVSWKMIEYAHRVQISNTVTGDLKLPVHLFIIIGAVGMFVFGLVALARMIDLIKKGATEHDS